MRKYYRFRPAKWYGGIVTGDVVGCNLLCLFCWAGAGIWGKTEPGDFYTPDEVFSRMDAISRAKGFRLWRLSGQEPTIGREHLLALLRKVEKSPYRFILETNGTLLDRSYARDLSEFKKIHVRVSLKGANEEEFRKLTKATGGFSLQLEALKNLHDAGVSNHASVMSILSTEKELEKLARKLYSINPSLVRELEVEEFIEYPHVRRRMQELIPKWTS